MMISHIFSGGPHMPAYFFNLLVPVDIIKTVEKMVQFTVHYTDIWMLIEKILQSR